MTVPWIKEELPNPGGDPGSLGPGIFGLPGRNPFELGGGATGSSWTGPTSANLSLIHI